MAKQTSQEKRCMQPWKKIDRASSRPVYQQIQDVIQQKINDGYWKPGELIESAPKLAKLLGTSYATVCRSIEVMVASGKLTTRLGAGTYVSKTVLQKSVLWIIGISPEGGDIGQYYLDCFDTGRMLLENNNIDVDLFFIGIGDDPMRHPKIAQIETLRKYSGIVLHACHREHPVRKALSRSGILFADLSHGTPKVTLPQVTKICTNLLLDWRKQKRKVVMIKRYDYQFPDLEYCDHLLLPDSEGLSESEQNGFKLAWDRLQAGLIPDAWLVTDDVVARGVTRAILSHSLQNNNAGALPKVVVSCHLKTALWHGMPVDYIIHDHAHVVEAGIIPFIDKILGRALQGLPPRTEARYVRYNDPELSHLIP